MDVNISDVTICRVMNSVDKTFIVLTTHWYEDHVKLSIIRSNDVPLKGQITKVKLAEPAETFTRTTEEYLQDIKRELAGKDNEIKFSLRNNMLSWNRLFSNWKRGSIKCEPLSDIVLFSSLVHGILVDKSNVEKSEMKYREENENLKRKVHEMESTMIKMTSIKNEMEDALNKKFLFILNTKKDLIRNLKNEIKKLSNSVYDKSTDVSDNEELDEVESVNPIKRVKMDNLLSEPRVEISMKTKSSSLSTFDLIAEKIADITNNNESSNDSDINLIFDESQVLV